MQHESEWQQLCTRLETEQRIFNAMAGERFCAGASLTDEALLGQKSLVADLEETCLRAPEELQMRT